MEWFRFIRETIWHNAGFGSLRSIRRHIEDYEPWFEPQIVPFPDSEEGDRSAESKDGEIPPVEASKPAKAAYPQARYYSVADYRQMFLEGTLTPTDVAEAILPLIRRDIPEPSEHAIAWFETKVERVLAAARASTERYKDGRSLGPLDGIPTAVKDEYDMDGYRTCLGSVNTYTAVPPEGESPSTWCVRKLEEAGAVILGKLSMHEFGLDTTGNNPFYGTPRNPHNRDYYTGGSSSGTGYSVAAGLIPIGLGSDGGGSIRIPSSMCSVFGLKPTHGRLSFRPGQNHCVTCATLGPIAADVESLAAVFQVIGQPHPTSAFPPLKPLNLLASPSAHPDKKKILGIPVDWFSRATPAIQTLCYNMIRRLAAEKGYTTVDITIPFLPEGQIAHALTVLGDAATLLPYPHDTSNLTHANRILLALGRVTPATDYILALKLRKLLMQHLAWLWKEYPGLLIMTPTTACEGLPIKSESELKWGVNDGDLTLASMEFVWLANFCGLPSISVPAGFVNVAPGPEAKKEMKKNKSKKIKGSSSGASLEDAAEEEKQPQIPVGLMAMGEWCAEEQLLQFGLMAEEVGADLRRRPSNWVDVVQRAKEVHGR